MIVVHSCKLSRKIKSGTVGQDIVGVQLSHWICGIKSILGSNAIIYVGLYKNFTTIAVMVIYQQLIKTFVLIICGP